MSATADPRIADAPFGPEGAGSPSEPPTAPPQEAPKDPPVVSPTDALEDVEKQIEHRTWHVEGDITGEIRGQLITEHIEREYTQKPLSYTSMIQFTGLLGRKIDEAMSGPEGLTLDSVAELAQVAQSAAQGSLALNAQDFVGVDAFVRGFAKLAAYVPEIMDEAQCIWLRVPFKDRMIVREIWGKPVDEGGLSMDDGEAMLTLFIQQNYEELERFFAERLRRIGQAIQKERKKIHPAD